MFYLLSIVIARSLSFTNDVAITSSSIQYEITTTHYRSSRNDDWMMNYWVRNLSKFIFIYISSDCMTIEQALLETKAVKLQPDDPFTWSSWMKSPIYCDNRVLMSFPIIRSVVVDMFVERLSTNKEIEWIAGVATWGIALWALIADRLWLPFVYIRSKTKAHGRQNLVEWDVDQAQNYILIEDLISTWKSSLFAVQAMRDIGKTVLWVAAIFSYEFPEAELNFAELETNFFSLGNYSTLIEEAIKLNYIDEHSRWALLERRKQFA